jgi:hypothetical protein
MPTTFKYPKPQTVKTVEDPKANAKANKRKARWSRMDERNGTASKSQLTRTLSSVRSPASLRTLLPYGKYGAHSTKCACARCLQYARYSAVLYRVGGHRWC